MTSGLDDEPRGGFVFLFLDMEDLLMSRGLALGIGAVLTAVCLSLMGPVDQAEAGRRHRCGGGCWGGGHRAHRCCGARHRSYGCCGAVNTCADACGSYSNGCGNGCNTGCDTGCNTGCGNGCGSASPCDAGAAPNTFTPAPAPAGDSSAPPPAPAPEAAAPPPAPSA